MKLFFSFLFFLSQLIPHNLSLTDFHSKNTDQVIRERECCALRSQSISVCATRVTHLPWLLLYSQPLLLETLLTFDLSDNKADFVMM